MKKIFGKTWFIIIMLIAFPPLGIFLMWKFKGWKKILKVVISVLSLFIIALWVLLVFNPIPINGFGKKTPTLVAKVVGEATPIAEKNTGNTKAPAEDPNAITGTKIVGEGTLAPGFYKLKLKDTPLKMGYIERSSTADLQFYDIIANTTLTGDGYLEIVDTDTAVKLVGVTAIPIKLQELEVNIKNQVEGGIHLVGYDISPGTYRVQVTDTATGEMFYQRTSSVSMDSEDIIASGFIGNNGTLTISPTDFALRIQGGIITKE